MTEAKLSARERKAFKETACRFLEAIKEIVDHCLITEDVDGLGRLVTQIDILQGYEILKVLRDKGVSKEITELCDRAGKKKVES
jgi:molybdopterin/thiamine biosynthesis adenylyltransferase